MSSNIVFVVSEAISGHRVDLKYQNNTHQKNASETRFTGFTYIYLNA